MARLDIAAAPPVSLPRMFLSSVPLWGAVAGALVIVQGESVFLSRWSGPTLALVHAVTLGVLGNAMLGALFQFLPAAAGVRVRAAVPCGRAVHGLLNAGAALLVVGFHGFDPAWLATAAMLLGAAFATAGVCVLPPLLRSALDRVTNAGIAVALFALLTAAALGIAMVGALTGSWPGLAISPWADVHAGWGLVAGAVGLLAAVAQTVVPMFHGAAAMGARAYTVWLAICIVVLVAWSLPPAGPMWRVALAACAATWAGSTLWRLCRGGRVRRNPTLVFGWGSGCVALIAASFALAAGASAPVVGALALGLALPLLVLPMLLEIGAFLGWIGLQRAQPRRRRVPGVDALQPERAKARVIALHAVAGLALATAAAWPTDTIVRAAGTLLVIAHAALAFVLVSARRRERRFLAGSPA